MFRKGLSILFNDGPRGDDRVTPSLAVMGKPPVLRRGTLNLLGVCLLAVICYGSLMPFELRSGWEWTWQLTLHKPSPTDFVANLMLYLPVGIFLRLFYRRRGTRAPSEITLSLLTILAVSYGTELCQIAIVDRVASLTDVVSNVAGAVMGILLAPAAQRGMRNLHGWLYTTMRVRPFTAAAAAVTLIVITFALMPFDPMPTRAHLQSRLAAVMTAQSLLPFGAGWGGDLEVRPDEAIGKVMAVAAYGVLAFLLVFAERERGRRPMRCAWYALTRAAALAAVVEGVQLFTISHAFDPADLTGAWFCAVGGTLIASGWVVMKVGLTLPRRVIVLRLLTLSALTVLILWAIVPSLSVERPGASPLQIGLPMLSHFHMGWNALMGHYVVAFLRYAAIAGVVVAWRRSSGRVPHDGMILAAAIGAVLMMTALAWWRNQPFDSCHLFLAGLAALLVHRADSALFGRPPRTFLSPAPSCASYSELSEPQSRSSSV
jgi:glycopeptide antibiotics resistance protein